MNKIITIYELLGLIKDDKAPKRIKWEGFIFSFYNDDYLCENEDFVKNRETNYLLCYLFSLPASALNVKIEILEENKPIIEKLKIKDNKMMGKWENGSDYHYTLSAPQVVIINKINEIISYLKDKEEE